MLVTTPHVNPVAKAQGVVWLVVAQAGQCMRSACSRRSNRATGHPQLINTGLPPTHTAQPLLCRTCAAAASSSGAPSSRRAYATQLQVIRQVLRASAYCTYGEACRQNSIDMTPYVK
jgi:hypothetical protein